MAADSQQDVVRLSTERAALRIKVAAADREAARLRQELQETDALLSAAQEAAVQASPPAAGDVSPNDTSRRGETDG